ncbi:hypothetical protein [Pseudovibrio sp. Ad37]|uniref:hypothetical protein n=1 Tax=Pseudovibrio sp. Ad37 TaxID=989422 RepID=UPI0007AE5B8E|nr:hypothetical protein [Pseudovibrio sp. Ad37]KZL13605.1 hypothetical protein PsAD37_05362 [Pseudovibrio sp. Ad37]
MGSNHFPSDSIPTDLTKEEYIRSVEEQFGDCLSVIVDALTGRLISKVENLREAPESQECTQKALDDMGRLNEAVIKVEEAKRQAIATIREIDVWGDVLAVIEPDTYRKISIRRAQERLRLLRIAATAEHETRLREPNI